MFDDCKGDKLQELLSAFSTIVLRKVLASEQVGRSSIVGRLCFSAKAPSKDHTSLLPLAVAHRSSLRTLLQKKEDLGSTYRDFGHALNQKDRDLIGKFDKVIEAQEFLDKNEPSENTVSRVAKVLDQHWQGDRRLVDIIAQGEEHGLRDVLLDQKFESVWSEVGGSRFDGDISTSRHGLLEDLEKRVDTQNARLQKWKEFKIGLEQKKRLTGAKPTDNSRRQAYVSPKSHRYEQRKEKDLVFSPRKSPRKSMWPLDSPTREYALEGPKDLTTNRAMDQSVSVQRADRVADSVSSSQDLKPRILFEMASKDCPSNSNVYREDDDSGFSEVATGDLEARQENIGKKNTDEISSGDTSSPKKIVEDGMSATPERKHEAEKDSTEKLDDDKLLAEQVVSFTLNAGPTPISPSCLSSNEPDNPWHSQVRHQPVQRRYHSTTPSCTNPGRGIFKGR